MAELHIHAYLVNKLRDSAVIADQPELHLLPDNPAKQLIDLRTMQAAQLQYNF